MKKCTKCGETKPLSEFGKDARKPDGRRPSCKVCVNVEQKAARLADPSKHRANMLKYVYGLTPQEYEELLCMCDAKCMICGMSAKDHKETTGRFLCVDHNHHTGKVRGLLCNSCNTVLGKMQDSPKLLTKAATYLLERE